ncbi:MAG: hypothetical protein U1F49_08295 [Rubrivivax sp.]
MTRTSAAAQKVKPDDKRLDAAMVEFPSPQGNGKAAATWCARPVRQRVRCRSCSSCTRTAA